MLRTLGGHVLWLICNGCQHAVDADQPAMIAAERGDVRVIDLRFRYGARGSHNTSIVMSGSLTGPPEGSKLLGLPENGTNTSIRTRLPAFGITYGGR